MVEAAVFDLDRTLLRGSSAPAINEALFETGLTRRRSLPGQDLLMKAYELGGENLPSMALARASARASKGWPVVEVETAADLAGERLERELAPWSKALFSFHRDAGRLLVLATTTPRPLVQSLADRLGFDAVVATEYGVEADRYGVDRYTGGIDGPFVWATGKLGALRRWAGEAGVDLAGSWAYSDSIFDLPMLSAVGHPTAVNPDPPLRVAATLRRWPVLHLDSPPGVPKSFGVEPVDLLRLFLPRAAFPYARFDIKGTDHIPRKGPVILVSNHRSYFDPVAIAYTAFDAGRRPRVLGKREVHDAPVVGPVVRALGGIRVDRDSREGSALAFAEAQAALEAGEMVVILPQGTIPRGEKFFDPHLVGRTGAARLAVATGAPVIPMGLWGTEVVWPRSARLPNVTKVLSPSPVRVRVGPAVEGLTGRSAKADTARIMSAISALLPAEAQLSRIPTAEELARTRPPA
jgi:putative phosphoserine phosphatase/1-acylglycerol-3-phosphate O-acyltransferase